jgi:hypothetical protein
MLSSLSLNTETFHPPHFTLDDINSIYGLDESSAIPPRKSAQPINVHTTLNLDGRTVAKNTMKHMASYNSHPAGGPRLPDNWITRPIT